MIDKINRREIFSPFKDYLYNILFPRRMQFLLQVHDKNSYRVKSLFPVQDDVHSQYVVRSEERSFRLIRLKSTSRRKAHREILDTAANCNVREACKYRRNNTVLPLPVMIAAGVLTRMVVLARSRILCWFCSTKCILDLESSQDISLTD